MWKDKKFIGRSIAGCMALGLLALTPVPGQAAEKLDVFTASTGFLYVTAYIAKQMGYFSDAGLDVTISDVGGGSNAVAALVGGSAQIGDVGLKNMSKPVERGISLKAIGTGINGFPNALVVRDDWAKKAALPATATLQQRMAMLKNATVAVQDVGGSSGGFVRYLLAEAGLPNNFVTVINMESNAGQLASLKARRIDAFVNTSPIWERAVTDGYGVDLVLPSRDMESLKGMAYIIQAVPEAFLKSHRETVKKYLIGIRRAQLLAQREPEKAKHAFRDYLASLTTAEATPDNVMDVMWAKSADSIPKDLVLQPEAIKEARAFFKIGPELTDAQLIDNSLAREVMASVK